MSACNKFGLRESARCSTAGTSVCCSVRCRASCAALSCVVCRASCVVCRTACVVRRTACVVYRLSSVVRRTAYGVRQERLQILLKQRNVARIQLQSPRQNDCHLQKFLPYTFLGWVCLPAINSVDSPKCPVLHSGHYRALQRTVVPAAAGLRGGSGVALVERPLAVSRKKRSDFHGVSAIFEKRRGHLPRFFTPVRAAHCGAPRASDHRVSDHRASDHRAPHHRASDQRAPHRRASDQRAPHHRALQRTLVPAVAGLGSGSGVALVERPLTVTQTQKKRSDSHGVSASFEKRRGHLPRFFTPVRAAHHVARLARQTIMRRTIVRLTIMRRTIVRRTIVRLTIMRHTVARQTIVCQVSRAEAQRALRARCADARALGHGLVAEAAPRRVAHGAEALHVRVERGHPVGRHLGGGQAGRQS